MNELRRELKVHHLGWQVLSAGIVESHATVLAAGHEQLTVRGVGKGLHRLVELSKLTNDTSLFEVEDSHGAVSETTGEDGQSWVSGHAQGLLDVASELNLLFKSVHVPQADGVILRNSHNASLGKVEVQRQNVVSVSTHERAVLLVGLVQHANASDVGSTDDTKTISRDIRRANSALVAHLHEKLTKVKGPHTKISVLRASHTESFIDRDAVDS